MDSTKILYAPLLLLSASLFTPGCKGESGDDDEVADDEIGTETAAEESDSGSTEDETGTESGETTTTEESTEESDTETDTTEESDETGTGEPDCDNLMPLPLEFVEVFGARRAEDYVFDAEGQLLSIRNEALFAGAYGELATLVVPGIASGFTSGTSMLPGGDLIFNDVNTGSVIRVDAEGSTSVIMGGLSYPNGLTVGNDGWVYVAENNGDRVDRFDPEDPEIEVLFESDGPNGLAFSADFNRLYVGSYDYGGLKVYDMETEVLTVINEDLEAIDGVLVDVCDNIYLSQFVTGNVWRIDPENQVELVVNLPSSWIPNLNFGSGIGGWELDRIYVNDLTRNRVFELVPGTVGIDVPHL